MTTVLEPRTTAPNGAVGAATRAKATGAPPARSVVTLERRTVDKVLVAAGMVAVIILAVAGGLLTWGSRFADQHVGSELEAQRVFFPPAAALEAEGRTDLLDRAGTQVLDGDDAKAYASYIEHHLDGIADGQTYADLGTVEREAQAAVAAAVDAGAGDDEVAALQDEADAVSGQRNSLFKGETLRGLLLSTYAWSTMGSIAGIAAMAAFSAAGAMFVLVALGIWHQRKEAKA